MTYRIINDGSDRAQWLEARNIGIGASEIPILFGCGYGDSAQLDLYARKIGANLPKVEANEGMNLGSELEPTIVRLACQRAEVSWALNRALLSNDGSPPLVCTPDAITTDGEPVEVKNICHRVDESEWEDGNIPIRYQLQLQTQIEIMEAKRGLFGALIFGGRIVWTWLDRDDELIREIHERASIFWGHVMRREPCAPNGTKSSRQAAVAVAETLPPKELFDEDMLPIVVELERAKADEAFARKNLAALESKRKIIEDSIILSMGSSMAAATNSGWHFKRTITKRKGGFTKPSESHGLKVIAPTEES